MPKTKVVFIELAIARKAKYLCDIVEKAYAGGLRVHIICESAAEAEHINQELWTWKQDTFIPHNLTQNLESDLIEPVLINTDSYFPNEAELLILYDPADNTLFSKYKLVVDFAETYDPEKLKRSRNRYKEILNHPDFDLEFTKLGSFLGTDLNR